MNTIQSVIETMDAANQAVPTEVIIPSKETMELRLRLEFEELYEKAQAMGLAGTFEKIINLSIMKHALEVGTISNFQHDNFTVGMETFNAIVPDTNVVDIVEVLDACCDQRVVNDGTIAAFGFHTNNGMSEGDIFHTAFFKVHENNMTKFPTSEGIAMLQQQALAERGVQVSVVPSTKIPGRFALIDAGGKYRKPIDFQGVDLSDLIPANVRK